MSFCNPIVPGFYPDPSCIRVEDTFYLINSSFQFFPGLPIHRSKDLINWDLIGHAINRPSQLSLDLATTKINNAERGEVFTAGLYAPTIRYHGGTFYIVCTNLTGRREMKPGEDFTPQNFIIKATDLADPESFSDPIYFDFFGIDPSLLFDDDGRVYMQGSFIFGYRLKPATTIKQAEIDVETGELKSDLVEIWAGAGGKCPEGPHMYKKDGLYWLMLAEGGTHRGHCITIAKSDNPWGPFESVKANPIVPARGAGDVIQCNGHGEMFDDLQGKWWCIMLARRELDGFYPLGRETYLAPATWAKREHPIIEDLELQQTIDKSRVIGQLRAEEIRRVTLKSPHAVYLRGLKPEYYEETGDILLLKGMSTDLGSPEGQVTLVGHRQTSLGSEAEVIVELDNTLPDSGSCGMAVYHDTFRYISLEIDQDNHLSLVILEAGKGPETRQVRNGDGCEAWRLKVRSSIGSYSFTYAARVRDQWGPEISIGEISSKIFSGDDFTGPVYCVYTSGERQTKFSQFHIKTA